MSKETISVFLKILVIILLSVLLLSSTFIFSRDLALNKKILIYFQMVFYLVLISLYLAKSFVDPFVEIKRGFKKMIEGNFNFQFYQEKKNKFFEDYISDLNKILIALRQFKEKQDILSKVKSDFVSMAAHQFRRPISEIKWILKMFLDGETGKLDKRQIDLINQAYKDNESMSILIDDLLNLAKIEERVGGYEFGSCDLEGVIGVVINDLNFAAKEKDIELVFEKSSKIPVIKADTTKIRLVIYNLIDNSIRYSYNKGKIIIRLELDRDSKFIKVSVQDFGIGIPKSEQKYIFEKFFRASNAKEKENVGTGLGLYIVRSIIERHGGQVGLISEVNKGSTFWFTLPMEAKLAIKNNLIK